MLRDPIEQIVSDGDLHILHDADRPSAHDVLDLIARELADGRTRTVCVTAANPGGLGLAELIAQLAGRPPSRAGPAPAVTDGDVESGHLALTQRNEGCERILLMIDGAQRLLPPALRYIQEACRIAPHLHLVFAGSQRMTELLDDPNFIPLRRRPITELHLGARTENADVSLAAALLSLPWVYGTNPAENAASPLPAAPVSGQDKFSAPTLPDEAPAAAPRSPLEDAPSQLEEPPKARRGARLPAVALGVAVLLGLAGGGAWLLQQAPAGLAVRSPIQKATLPPPVATATTEVVALQPTPGTPPPAARPNGPSMEPPAPRAEAPAAARSPQPDAAAASSAANPVVEPDAAAPMPRPEPAIAREPPAAVPAPDTPSPAPVADAASAPAVAAQPEPPREATPSPAAETPALPPPPVAPGAAEAPLSNLTVSAEPPRETAPPAPAPPSASHDSMDAAAPAAPTPAPAEPDASKPASQDESHMASSATKTEITPPQPVVPAPLVTNVRPPLSAKIDSALADQLVRRADAMLQQGDISAARLLYERAADTGSGPAATAMGKTFDPVFLAEIGAVGLQPDPARAASWYGRGSSLGDPEARTRLQALQSAAAASPLEKRE